MCIMTCYKYKSILGVRAVVWFLKAHLYNLEFPQCYHDNGLHIIPIEGLYGYVHTGEMP